jgi:hypothetical protein
MQKGMVQLHQEITHTQKDISTTTTGSYSHAEGQSTTAQGGASHAEGYGTQAQGYIHTQKDNQQ